jgi:hypothetical protein
MNDNPALANAAPPTTVRACGETAEIRRHPEPNIWTPVGFLKL